MELVRPKPTFLHAAFKAIFSATLGTVAVVVALFFLAGAADQLR